MVNSFRVLLERILLLAVCFIIPSILLLLYLSWQKQDLADRVAEEYLKGVVANGVIDRDEHEQFLIEIARVSGCGAELYYEQYSEEPYYGYYSANEINNYYKKRNMRTNYPVFSTQGDVYVADTERLFLQEKSNASVFAELLEDVGTMIPVDGGVDSYKVIVPEQEVYVGEALVTVLLQVKDGVAFIQLADNILAPRSGEYSVPLTINGNPIGESINVRAWNKSVTCGRGHEYPATKEVIECYKLTGRWEQCPYCHAYVDDVAANIFFCEVPLGTSAEGVPMLVCVTYMDGTEASVPLADVSHNYDPNYMGEQSIEVSVGGVTKQVGTVTTFVPACSSCGEVISGRCYTDYEKEKRCAACLQNIPLFLGETFNAKETVGNERIVEALLSEGKFDLGRGNYLSLSVYKEGRKRSFMDADIFFRKGKVVKKTGSD